MVNETHIDHHHHVVNEPHFDELLDDKKMIQKHKNILHRLESDACNSMRKKDVGHILYEVCCQLCADLFI